MTASDCVSLSGLDRVSGGVPSCLTGPCILTAMEQLKYEIFGMTNGLARLSIQYLTDKRYVSDVR